MKKNLSPVFLTFLMLFSANLSLGQQINAAPETVQEKNFKPEIKPAWDQAKALPFWSEDFGNGFSNRQVFLNSENGIVVPELRNDA